MLKNNPEYELTTEASWEINYKWTQLSDQQKWKYMNMEKVDEERYQAEIKIYMEKNQGEPWAETAQ